jgi:hypothetical protein
MYYENRNSEVEDAYRAEISLLNFGLIYTRKDINTLVKIAYSKSEESILPSDYCYNLINKDIKYDFEKRAHFFEYVKRNAYKYIGENAPFSGKILWKNKYVVGEWQNGKIIYLDKNKIV